MRSQGKAIYFTRTAHPATRQPRGITDEACTRCGRRPVVGWISRYDPSSGGRDLNLCRGCWNAFLARERREEQQRLALLARIEEVS
jgi:hypothetical protein